MSRGTTAPPPWRRGRALGVTIGAFAFAGAAIAWRYVATGAPPVDRVLEVTVVDIQPAAPTVPTAAPATIAPSEPAPSDPPPSEPAPLEPVDGRPTRPARPAQASRPKRLPTAAAVSAPTVIPPPSDPAPARKPDPKTPPLEENPYVYK